MIRLRWTPRFREADETVEYIEVDSPAVDTFNSLIGPGNLRMTKTAGTLVGPLRYAVTSLRGAEETLATNLIVDTANNEKVQLTWDADPAATGYKVYGRGLSTGYLATVVGTSFLDDGSITPAGHLNTVNTTVPRYPVLGALSITARHTDRTLTYQGSVA